MMRNCAVNAMLIGLAGAIYACATDARRTPDSAVTSVPTVPRDTLPPRPYSSLPGWYVPAGDWAPPDSFSTQFGAKLARGANLRLYVFPSNTAWTRAHDVRASLLFSGGEAPVRIIAGDSAFPLRDGASVVSRVDVALEPVRAGGDWLSGFWLLPHPIAGAAVLVPTMAALGDTAVVWTADGVALVVRRTSKTAAQLFARTPTGIHFPILNLRIDREADSSFGVASDSILRLDDQWRIPHVRRLFRFGRAGPWVFEIIEQGYECSNFRLIRIDAGSAALLGGDEYYSQCST